MFKNIDKSLVAIIAIITAVIVALVILIVAFAGAMNRWTEQCESLGGTVVTTSMPGYGLNPSTGKFAQYIETTSTCTANGSHVSIKTYM